MSVQRTLTYFVRESITVWLISCLSGLDSTKLVNLYLIQHEQSSQTGGQPYIDTSQYDVSECSLVCLIVLMCPRDFI